jgi:hypothetical protein
MAIRSEHSNQSEEFAARLSPTHKVMPQFLRKLPKFDDD